MDSAFHFQCTAVASSLLFLLIIERTHNGQYPRTRTHTHTRMQQRYYALHSYILASAETSVPKYKD